MKKEDLIIYEYPWYAGYVSWNWLQEIIAIRLARKVERKHKRYLYRVKMHELFLKANQHENTN